MGITRGVVLDRPFELVNESLRLESLREYAPQLLTDDPELTAITRFAAELCGTPIALVSLVEDERQCFLARTGLETRETPRSQSFCAHAMFEAELMVVLDARNDARFADNPLVTGEPFIRFYAGEPLIGDDGAPLGALCVIGPEPREAPLDGLQRSGLKVLARAVMRRLKDAREELAREHARDALAHSEERFAILADSMPQIVWSARPDGHHDYFNARWYDFTGVPAGSTDGEGWRDMFHPDDQERLAKRWSRSLETGEPYEIEYRLRDAAGEYRWTLGRALPMRGPDGSILRWFGTCTDIHDRKLIAENLDLVSRELVHRIKNIFSVVGGLANVTAREQPQARDAFGEFGSRLDALARAYDFVRPADQSPGNSGGGSLGELFDSLFAPYRSNGRSQIVVSGDDLTLGAQAMTALALLFHELATNAVKHGALSMAGGRVDLSVRSTEDEVVIEWIEHGGPAARPGGKSTGFGTRLIETTMVRQLKGRIERDWTEEGLRLTVHLSPDVLDPGSRTGPVTGRRSAEERGDDVPAQAADLPLGA